jgi:hypothetical protein
MSACPFTFMLWHRWWFAGGAARRPSSEGDFLAGLEQLVALSNQRSTTSQTGVGVSSMGSRGQLRPLHACIQQHPHCGCWFLHMVPCIHVPLYRLHIYFVMHEEIAIQQGLRFLKAVPVRSCNNRMDLNWGMPRRNQTRRCCLWSAVHDHRQWHQTRHGTLCKCHLLNQQ